MWHRLTPDTLPPANKLVLLRLRQPGCVIRSSNNTFTKAKLQPDVFYGFVTAFLLYVKDGFGRDVPFNFQSLTYDPATVPEVQSGHGFHFKLSTTIEFTDVEAWMSIPDNTNNT